MIFFNTSIILRDLSASTLIKSDSVIDNLLNYTISQSELTDPNFILSYLTTRPSVYVKYPVHVVIMTNKFKTLNIAATKKESRKLIAQHIVDELNNEFILENGNKIFTFQLESIQAYSYSPSEDGSDCQDIRNLGDAVNEIDGSKYYKSGVWAAAVNKCDILLNKKAFNVIIYDAYDSTGSSTSETSRGNSNKNYNYQSYILLDYQRISDDYKGQNVQNPVTHETGHAFGLAHTCDLNSVDKNSPSNIMASSNSIKEESDFDTFDDEVGYDCPGSGGKRLDGFTPHQLMNILEISYQHGQHWLH